MKIAVCADLHANKHAAHHFMAHIRDQVKQIWFGGDVMGRGPYIREAVEFLRDCVVPDEMYVIGNHDTFAFGLLTTDEESRFEKDQIITDQKHKRLLRETNGDLYQWVSQNISRDNGAPRWKKVEGRWYGMVHGTFTDPLGLMGTNFYAFPWPDLPLDGLIRGLLEPAAAIAQQKGVQNIVVFCGHSHEPMMLTAPIDQPDNFHNNFYRLTYGETITIPDGITIINPGSMGNPRHHTPSFVILDAQKRAPTVTFQSFALPEQCMKNLYADMAGYPNRIRDSLQDPNYYFQNAQITAKYFESMEQRQQRSKLLPPLKNPTCCK